jgi:hypothetical protein
VGEACVGGAATETRSMNVITPLIMSSIERVQLSLPIHSDFDGEQTIKARDLSFDVCDSRTARSFISRGHYSGKCPPSAHYFCAMHEGELLGAMTFRVPSLPKVANGYKADLELARLYLSDKAGRNSESRFIGWSLRWLAKNTSAQTVISYADPAHGHTGAIYAAANFEYYGLEKGHGTRLLVVNGEELQAKTAYDRWGASGKNLEAILGVPVEVRVMPKKHVWLKRIASKRRKAA